MFTLRQSLGALAAIVAAPLASAAPVTTFSRIGVSSNGMGILNLQINAAMSPGHLTENTTMSFVVDTHSSKVICSGSWAPEGPYPEGEYVGSSSNTRPEKQMLTFAQIACANSTLGWNFKENTYKGLDDFTLQMEYTYTDDSYVTIFLSQHFV